MLGEGLGPRCKSAYPGPAAKCIGPAVKSCAGGKSGATEPPAVLPRWVPSDEPSEVRARCELTEFPRAIATVVGSCSSMVGRPLVAGGSQLTGSRRSSNRREAPNFHLRMMVQIAAAPTTQEAATMRPTMTPLGRKEAPWSLDLSDSWGAEPGATDVVVTRTVDWRPVDPVELGGVRVS